MARSVAHDRESCKRVSSHVSSQGLMSEHPVNAHIRPLPQRFQLDFHAIDKLDVRVDFVVQREHALAVVRIRQNLDRSFDFRLFLQAPIQRHFDCGQLSDVVGRVLAKRPGDLDPARFVMLQS